jgi:hypothetical protein
MRRGDFTRPDGILLTELQKIYAAGVKSRSFAPAQRDRILAPLLERPFFALPDDTPDDVAIHAFAEDCVTLVNVVAWQWLPEQWDASRRPPGIYGRATGMREDSGLLDEVERAHVMQQLRDALVKDARSIVRKMNPLRGMVLAADVVVEILQSQVVLPRETRQAALSMVLSLEPRGADRAPRGPI